MVTFNVAENGLEVRIARGDSAPLQAVGVDKTDFVLKEFAALLRRLLLSAAGSPPSRAPGPRSPSRSDGSRRWRRIGHRSACEGDRLYQRIQIGQDQIAGLLAYAIVGSGQQLHHERRKDLLALLVEHVGDADARALGREQQGRLSTDPTRGAGDDRDLSVESAHQAARACLYSRACSTSASNSFMSSPASGCHSTPSANRCRGSSIPSIEPSSACADARSPSPTESSP